MLIRFVLFFLILLWIIWPVPLKATEIDSPLQEIEHDEIVEAPNQTTKSR